MGQPPALVALGDHDRDRLGKLIGADAYLMYFGTVTIKLSDPQQKSGTRYFEKIHIIGGKPGVAHYWHWLWPDGNYIG